VHKSQTLDSGANGNKTLVFMGEKGVGKSSLVSKFLDENVAD
jgi:putative ribosome biogenesis GTPase RsgA